MPDVLMAIPGLGQKSFTELKDVCDALGFRIGEDLEPKPAPPLQMISEKAAGILIERAKGRPLTKIAAALGLSAGHVTQEYHKANRRLASGRWRMPSGIKVPSSLIPAITAAIEEWRPQFRKQSPTL